MYQPPYAEAEHYGSCPIEATSCKADVSADKDTGAVVIDIQVGGPVGSVIGATTVQGSTQIYVDHEIDVDLPQGLAVTAIVHIDMARAGHSGIRANTLPFDRGYARIDAELFIQHSHCGDCYVSDVARIVSAPQGTSSVSSFDLVLHTMVVDGPGGGAPAGGLSIAVALFANVRLGGSLGDADLGEAFAEIRGTVKSITVG